MKDPLDDKKEGLDRAWEVARLNDMIKVASISRILEKVALILGKNQLAINASKVESLVLKGIVSVDSLYIR